MPRLWDGPMSEHEWVRLSKEKPTATGIYPVWCFDACWLDWNGDNFVDRYGIPHKVTHWMRILEPSP